MGREEVGMSLPPMETFLLSLLTISWLLSAFSSASTLQDCPHSDSGAQAAALHDRISETRAYLLRAREILDLEAIRGQVAFPGDNDVQELDRVLPVEEAKRREEGLKEGGKCLSNRVMPDDIWKMGTVDNLPAWTQEKDRFILVNCQYGQASNRVRCYTKHMKLAGFLNRTLIFPYRQSETKGLYNPRLLIPLVPLKKCYGNDSLMTTTEYRHRHAGAPVVVDRVICIRGDKPCMNKEASRQLPELQDVEIPSGLELHMLGFPENAILKKSELVRSVDAISRDARVLLFNDMQSEYFEHNFFAGDLPFSRREGCHNFLAPQLHPAVIQAADAFMKSQNIREQTMAVHWRRGDMMAGNPDPLAHFSPKESAQCISEIMKANNLSTLFIASDANASELATFRDVIHTVLPSVVFKSLPSDWSEQSWAEALWSKHGFTAHDHAQIAVGLDKAVCAFSRSFIGTTGSSFSMDISRLRKGLRRASCIDGWLCSSKVVS